MLLRFYDEKMSNYLKKGKVLVIYGLRRTRKTILIREFRKDYEGKVFSGIGEDRTLKNILEACQAGKSTSTFAGIEVKARLLVGSVSRNKPIISKKLVKAL